MALSLVSVLRQRGTADQDLLAQSFGEHFNPSRGYGLMMHRLLPRLRAGADWRSEAASLFGGQGSFGNGAAMRVAPLGAFLADDLDAVVEQARRSAEVTHTHPEGIAGAIAVAVAAACAARLCGSSPTRSGFLDHVLPLVLPSTVRDKIQEARDLPANTSSHSAAIALGNGSQITAQDTVGFALWCAGECLGSYEEALWLTVSGLGDIDTNAAIVGGIVALYVGQEGIPQDWLRAREPLPTWPFEAVS